MKKRRFPLLLLVAPLLAAAVLAYFSLASGPPPVSYLTEPARIADIRKTVNASGETEAVQLVSVGAQASGQIEKLHVELGHAVRKGDPIADIDSTKQQNDLDISRARLVSLEAQLASKRISLRVAKTQFDREALLKKTDATSRRSLDDAENAYVTARAAVAELESQVTQARIAVNTAETNLGYTRIVAPLDGIVVSVPVEEGQTVNAAQITPTIVQIADLRRMAIKIEIAEGDITKIRPGMEVEYSILSLPNQTFTTTLSSIDPGPSAMTDGTYKKVAGSSAAVFYYANAIVDNADGSLRIGMTTQNAIAVDSVRQTLIVPSIAIQSRDGKPYVQVLHPPGLRTQGEQPSLWMKIRFFLARHTGMGRPVPVVEDRFIETGLSDNMNTQVLSGLAPGDLVITTQMSREEMGSAPPPRMPRRM